MKTNFDQEILIRVIVHQAEIGIRDFRNMVTLGSDLRLVLKLLQGLEQIIYTLTWGRVLLMVMDTQLI